MPSSLVFKMSGDPDKRYGAFMASILHGFMMERIDPAYATVLHESRIHPFSQFVEEKDGEILWHINTLTEEADEAIAGPLLDENLTELELRHRDETLHILDRKITRFSYEDFIRDYYLGECSHYLPIKIRTPMAFKQNGRYCIIPSTRLIFQSLMKRFDTCSPDSSIFTDELLAEFEELTEIADYRLRSVRFSLEGVKIPSFMGDMTIHIGGPQQMANVAWMLAKFGELSGIGIKTGIGMGAVSVERYQNSGQRRKNESIKAMSSNGKGDPSNG